MEAIKAHCEAVDRNRGSVVLSAASSDEATSEVVTDVPTSFSCLRASLYSRKLSRLDKRQRGGVLLVSDLGEGFGVEGGASGMSTNGELCIVSMLVVGVFMSNMQLS